MPILDSVGHKLKKVIGEEQELLDAARTGCLVTVERILFGKHDKGKKSTGVFGQRLTSFWRLVNVNSSDKTGSTALHQAAVNGHREIVEALLKADAQPGLCDLQGCTPVHLAAWKGDAKIVMDLLMAGTEAEPGVAASVQPVHVNHQNSSGDTALHSAAQYGHVAVVDVLLQKGANPTIRNLYEETPLDLAAQYGRLDVVKLLLLKHPELSQHRVNTPSPLHLASRNGHKDVVIVLLENNFHIQTLTESGTALHEAALHGKLDVVYLLLERGIDVTQTDQNGMTALEILGKHPLQKAYTEIMQAIKVHLVNKDSESEQGLYENLASYSVFNKPTAAVKPLLPELLPRSKTPSPQLSPTMKKVQASPPIQPKLLEKQNQPLKLSIPARQDSTEVLDNTTVTSTNKVTSQELLPEPERLVEMKSLYEKIGSDRVGNTATVEAESPPLPTSDNKSSVSLVSELDVLEKPVGNKVIPKKPPRHGKTPTQMHQSQPNINLSNFVPLSPSKLASPDVGTVAEIPNIDSSESEHSCVIDQCDADGKQMLDNLHKTDAHSSQTALSVSAVLFPTADSLIADRSVCAETYCVETASAVPFQNIRGNLSPYSQGERPISGVKPMLKEDQKLILEQATVNESFQNS